MSWVPPDWMNADDRQSLEDCTDALRLIVTDLRAMASHAETEQDLRAWRWRLTAIAREAKNLQRLMQKSKTLASV